LQMWKQGGDLPKWPMANGYTGAMDGTHANVVVGEAILKGFKNFDINTAYKAMVQAATTNQKHAGRDCLDQWINLGFIPNDCDNRGVCSTLAYAYDDWVLSVVAKSLGNDKDYITFQNRSQNNKNVWHPQEKFFCPKLSSGEWACPDTWINIFDSSYVEGDAWHYRFFVPGDIPGLIKLFGDNKTFTTELEYFMANSEWDKFNVLPNPYYWAGNEPGLLSPWLFNYGGRYDLTQKYVRWVLDNKYTIYADGLPGNDDYGTMSAWLIFGYLGFYPVAGSTTFILGSPVFETVVIDRPEGKITVIAHNYSPENIYVSAVTINGRSVDLSNALIDWVDIKNGATLEFWMKK